MNVCFVSTRGVMPGCACVDLSGYLKSVVDNEND